VFKQLNHLTRFVRWNDWGPGKIPVLCAVLYYIGLANQQVSLSFIVDFILFIIYASLHSALGFVVNDWGDRELDIRHNKPNAFANLTHSQGLLALGILFVLAFLSGLPFVQEPMVLPLWIAWAFVALGYSLKPVRLKERGVWGLTVAFLAQWSLPIFLAFAAFNRFGGWDMVIFAIAVTISGATLEIAHQRWDRTRDLSTGTNTLGSRMSSDKLDQIYATALILDEIFLGIVLLTMTVNIGPFEIGSWLVWPLVPLFAVYVLLFAGVMVERIQIKKQQNVLLDPYYSEQRSAAKFMHETLSNLVLPLYLLMVATFLQPINGILLIAFLFWRLVLGQADWLWPWRAAKNWLKGRRQVGTS